MTTQQIKDRLEYLRSQLEAENISYSELEELQSLAEYIEAGDVRLLEAAGVPEEIPQFAGTRDKLANIKLNNEPNYIEIVQKALDNIDNDDENLNLLATAMDEYCSVYDICEGYKQAIMLTVRDQYDNHGQEQDGEDVKALLKLLK